MLKEKNYEKLKDLLPRYLAENTERWAHWIQRLMQKKILNYFIEIIPKDTPRLQLKLYTKIFEHFMELKDYASFKKALIVFPPYLINQDYLIEVLKREIEKDKELAHDENLLESLFELHQMNRDYQTAFHILVKMKSRKVYEFLKRV